LKHNKVELGIKTLLKTTGNSGYTHLLSYFDFCYGSDPGSDQIATGTLLLEGWIWEESSVLSYADIISVFKLPRLYG
jgi:hypothetical protein